jgi:ribosome-binding protein aMBF1 (putative translation factor)
MKKSMHKKIPWTAADRARHKAIRDKFQREKPTPEELQATGDYESMTVGSSVLAQVIAHDLKAARAASGLSLAEVSERTGMDPSALSRLENGRQPNPTVDTLWRYAAAVGKDLRFVLAERPAD